MPVMDGSEFLKQKKQDAALADIPVVMITADDSRQQQVHALSMGVNDYIVKPFIPEVVIRRVCNVLESQKLSHLWRSQRQEEKNSGMSMKGMKENYGTGKEV